jgi:hypothetical protein
MERRARLLFSWREKAQALAGGRRLPREQDLPEAMDARKAAAYFDEQHRRARREADEFRARLRGCMENAQDLVRVALHQQRLLAARADEGRAGAKAVNDENRRLQEEIRTWGAEANLCSAVLAFESSKDLGGFIDLPLPRYESELERFMVAKGSDSESGARAESAPGETVSPSTGATGWPKRLRALVPKPLGPWDYISISVAMVAVLAAVIFFLYSTQFAGAVAFDVLPAPQGAWVLSVENRTPHKVTVAVPGNVAQGLAKVDYAVYVEMQDSGQGDFRRLPDAERAWVYGGSSGMGGGPVAVASGLSAKWTLSPGKLALPNPGTLLRVVVVSGHRTVCTRELAFQTRQ